VVFRAVVFKLLVWCGAEGYVSGLQDAAASCKPECTVHTTQRTPKPTPIQDSPDTYSTRHT